MSVAAADVQEGHAGLAQAGLQATGGNDLDRAPKMRMVVDDAKELLVALAQRSHVLQVVKFGQQPRTGICVPKDPVDGRSRTSSQWILARRALPVRLVRGGVGQQQHDGQASQRGNLRGNDLPAGPANRLSAPLPKSYGSTPCCTCCTFRRGQPIPRQARYGVAGGASYDLSSCFEIHLNPLLLQVL